MVEPRYDAGRSARDYSPVSPRGLQGVLALEVPREGRRPKIDRGLRNLIRRMSRENSKWGHPGAAAATNEEIGFAGDTTLPRQDHHTHTPLQGAIRWRLIVWADHNPK